MKSEIRELVEEDLAELVDFVRAQLQQEQPAPEGPPVTAGVPTADQLGWFVFRNPARDPEIPVGWTMRDPGDRIVGTMFCVPQRFCSGDRVFLLLMSSSYYVDERYRGFGMAIFQRYRKLARYHALYCTTANDQSGAFWKRFGGYPIADTDHESVGILRVGPVAEEWLQRKWGSTRLSQLASWVGRNAPTSLWLRARRRAAACDLTPIGPTDTLPRLDAAAHADIGDRLTALRDEAFLRWRYFEGPDPTTALYRFRSESGSDALVGVSVRNRGHRGQIRTLTVLDAWGALPGRSIAELGRQLARDFSKKADMIVFRGLDPGKHEALAQEGFIRRNFSCPIGWCIDPESLLPTRDWYLAPADGDMAV